ncbi:IS630 family transposase [Propionibacterium australiense]|uniref:Ribonuclease H-like domain n=1 Tax=Propionibacterium australiense TaxID=119981 RepID=A0A383SAN0_9ACTN|nr:IS630 family transposase [Propionibacterium australiense]RLP06000.1 IS630 family transposase [Propionibacterium australiense]SYZ34612.1 Ribonuclease H-like domain [Propionibacterium australiense]VEH92517.1 Transposase and inactivated derivatives [Propionibacterium australiense]
MQIEVTPEETAVLIRWKKRTDNYVLVRMKAEAILYASEQVGINIIAKMVERSEKTVREWLAEWQDTRMCSVLTGHAGNQNAAKLTRAQKEDLKAVLAQPPSRSGIDAEFWDVPALRDVVKILFDVEYESESSYQLLLRFCGLSFKLPDPFDKHRDEQAITRRMTEVKAQVKDLLGAGCEVYAIDEVRLEHEAETRRMWLPKGQRTKFYVDRQKVSQSFFGALSLTDKKMRLYPIEGNQNTEQIILALDRLQRETKADRIAVVLDNARFHHAKALTSLYQPGQLLERITPVFLPPYAPDHNPVEHVWGTAKNNIANIQHQTPEQTFGAFASYITGRTFDYDFEHLPKPQPETDLVS